MNDTRNPFSPPTSAPAASTTTRWQSALATVVAWVLVALTTPALLFRCWYVVSALLSDSKYDRSQLLYRMTGPHAWVFWLTSASIASPLLLWAKPLRRRLMVVAVVAAAACVAPGLSIYTYMVIHRF